MSTKADIINAAFEDIRISGITVSQGPSGNVIALNRLEEMMAQYLEGQNIDVNYNFEETPDINSPTGVTIAHNTMMVANLATRVVTAYGKSIPQELYLRARGGLNSSASITARNRTNQIQPSSRMPRGSGNTLREPTWVRYNHPVSLPPTVPGVENILSGETQNFTSDFSAWLGDNTIATATLVADPRITIDSSSTSGGTVSYTVTATENASYGPWQYVQITVTDSAGRVNIRLISFEVIDPPEVG